MTDVGRDHHHPSNDQGAPSAPPSSKAVLFVVVLLAGLGAALAANGLGGGLGIAVAAAISVAGAAGAVIIAGKSVPPDVKATALLDAVSAENPPSMPPSRFRAEPWASLYLLCVADAEAQRTATLAVQEVERLRGELEKKGTAAATDAAPFEPSPSHGENELVGAGHESDPDSAPVVANDRAPALQALALTLPLAAPSKAVRPGARCSAANGGVTR